MAQTSDDIVAWRGDGSSWAAAARLEMEYDFSSSGLAYMVVMASVERMSLLESDDFLDEEKSARTK